MFDLAQWPGHAGKNKGLPEREAIGVCPHLTDRPAAVRRTRAGTDLQRKTAAIAPAESGRKLREGPVHDSPAPGQRAFSVRLHGVQSSSFC